MPPPPLNHTPSPSNPITFPSERAWRRQRRIQQTSRHILLHTCASTFESKNSAFFFCFSSSRVTPHTRSLQTSTPVFLPCQVSTEAAAARRPSSPPLTPRRPPPLRASWVRNSSGSHPQWLLHQPHF